MPFLAPIGVFFAKSFTVAAIKAALVQVAVGTAISVGVDLLSRLLQPRRKPLEAIDGAKHTIRAEITPARWVLGRARVPGVLHFWGASGRIAKMGLLLSEGACEEIDDEMWIDGHAVKLTRTASAAGDLLTPVSTSKYHGKIEIREYFKADGTQGTHLRTPAPSSSDPETEYRLEDGLWALNPDWYTELCRNQGETETLPFVTSHPQWGTTHYVKGISWVYVKLTQPPYGQDLDKRFWTQIPNLEFLVKGIKITWPGQTTATWTGNAAALRYWWETERRGRASGDIHTGDFTAAYNLCEQTVDVTNGGADPLPDDYEDFNPVSKRYSINGVVSAGDDVSQIEDQFDAAWAGEVIESAGQLRFKPGADAALATLALTDDDIIEPPVVQPWAALQDRVNAVEAQIAQSRAHQYTQLGLPQYVDQSALDRDGVKRPGQIELAFVSDPIAAGRLQAVILRRARESLRLELVVVPGENLERLALVPTDRVLVTNSEFGLTSKRMEVERVTIREDWSVALTLREDLDDTYDDTLVLPPLLPRVIRLDPVVPAVQDLGADEIAEIANDGTTLVHLVVRWTAAAVSQTEIRVREKAAAGEDENDWESGVSLAATWRLSGVAAGKTYEIEARHRSRSEVAGEWSAIEHEVGGDLTAPAAPTNLNVEFRPEGFLARWINPDDEDFAVACVYAGTTNQLSSATLLGTVAADYFAASQLTIGTTYYVWVRAKDHSGNLSAAIGPVSVTPSQIPTVGAHFYLRAQFRPDRFNGFANIGGIDFDPIPAGNDYLIGHPDGTEIVIPIANRSRMSQATIERYTGRVFVIFSKQLVNSQRSLSAYQDSHILVVRFENGVYEYDNNSSWQSFTPNSTDMVIYEVRRSGAGWTGKPTRYVGQELATYIQFSGRDQLLRRIGTHGQNLLFNFSFEDYSAFWNPPVSGISYPSDSTRAYTGNRYLKINTTVGVRSWHRDSEGNVKLFEMCKGDKIEFGGWIYRESGSGNARIYLNLYDKNKSYLSRVAVTQNTAAWKIVTGSKTIGTSEKYVSLVAYNSGGGGTGTVARFDDCFLRFVRPAGQVQYNDGKTVESLKPGEKDSDKTSAHLGFSTASGTTISPSVSNTVNVWKNIPEMSVTVTTKGGKALVIFHGNATTTAGSSISTRLLVDGVAQAGSNRYTIGSEMHVNSWIVTGLTDASHTFLIQGKSNASTSDYWFGTARVMHVLATI